MKELEIAKDILKNDHLFLTGGGGVGKSYLTQQLIDDYRARSKQVVILGSTGISAVNIGGQTVHSFFAFGICKNSEELLRHDRYNRQRIKEINQILNSADLLIIDEISMISAALMEMIRYRLDGSNFGGSLLFVGDFFQLPPIDKRDDNSSLFGNEIYAFESSAWKNYDPKILELTVSKRSKDSEFVAILNKIRKGEVNEATIEFLRSLRQNSAVEQTDATILFGRNYEAERTNKERLSLIDSELRILDAEQILHDKTLSQMRIDSWHKSLNIPLRLELKIGAHVIFCANKWGKYFNGERGIIRAIHGEYLLIEKGGSLLKVEPHEFSLFENVLENAQIQNKPLATIKQFPIKLSYAITIHKSQGMSIENLVCDINQIFEKSQFYVAISRATSSKSLYLRYGGRDFEGYVKRCVVTDERVREFYDKAKIKRLQGV